MSTSKNISVGGLHCRTDAQGQTQCEVDGSGNGESPCVDGTKERWVSPGDAAHSQRAQIEEIYTDGNQSWARLTNGNVVPVCSGSAPAGATQVNATSQGVSVGQVQEPEPEPSPPDPVGVSQEQQTQAQPQPSPRPQQPPRPTPTPAQVCPPGHTLMADGSCIVPGAVATPDPSCPSGHYLRETGECVPVDFDPKSPEAAPADASKLPEMMPDMPPASTPAPGATFDAKTGKLRAPDTMFDGMEIKPYGHGRLPPMYGRDGHAVFFVLGVSKMFAFVAEDHGACCSACAVGGACERKRQMNPADAHAPRGSVRLRMGKPEPKHGSVSVRDRTTKIVTADEGYVFSLQPLASPVEEFEDAYGRKVYVGKKVWSAPMPVPVSSTVPTMAGGPQVLRQGPVVPGGIGPSMRQGVPGLPPRNPEWEYKGPLDGVKL